MQSRKRRDGVTAGLATQDSVAAQQEPFAKDQGGLGTRSKGKPNILRFGISLPLDSGTECAEDPGYFDRQTLQSRKFLVGQVLGIQSDMEMGPNLRAGGLCDNKKLMKLCSSSSFEPFGNIRHNRTGRTAYLIAQRKVL